MTYNELRKTAKKLGISAAGNSKELKSRIRLAKATKQAENKKKVAARKTRDQTGMLNTAQGSRRETLIAAFISKGSITLDEIKGMAEIQNPNAAGYFGAKTMRYLVASNVAKKTGRGVWVLAKPAEMTTGQIKASGRRLKRIYT